MSRLTLKGSICELINAGAAVVQHGQMEQTRLQAMAKRTGIASGANRPGASGIFMSAMKLLYKPYSIVSKIIGARAGQKAFSTLWGRVSESPKPSPKQPEVGLGRVAVSAALEGATLSATAAVITQLSVRLFHHLFGVWPEKPQDQNAAQSVERPAPQIDAAAPAEATQASGRRWRPAWPRRASAPE
jgi:hypothetical protein